MFDEHSRGAFNHSYALWAMWMLERWSVIQSGATPQLSVPQSAPTLDMSVRITYWTGIWSPAREAISREVEQLRSERDPRPFVVSVSSGQSTRWRVQDRVFRLSGARLGLLRGLGAVVERFGDVTHVFGASNSWHLLRAVGRRPVVMTVVLSSPDINPSHFDSIHTLVVETEALRDELVAAGVSTQRIRLIYPGVDLDRFRPAPLLAGRFRLLFASTPADPREFEARGIPLMIEAARRCPDVDFVSQWRRWGDAHATNRALALLQPPSNFRVEHRDLSNMAEAYNSSHATVCLFDRGFGKSCPNSVIEGLACGRPALVSEGCGIAGLVDRQGAGLAVGRDPAEVALAIERLRRDYDRFAVRARSLAEEHFDLRRFVLTYRELYDNVAAPATAGRSTAGRMALSRRAPTRPVGDLRQ